MCEPVIMGWDLASQDYEAPPTLERVEQLKRQADALDFKADHMVALIGRSPMFKHIDVWRLREQAKNLRAKAVALVIGDAV